MTDDGWDDDEPFAGEPTDDDGRAHDGVEHLQRAAREMIAAGRAFLDVVEDLVDRPEAVQEVLGVVGSLGDAAARAVRADRRATTGREQRARDGEHGEGGPDEGGDPPVQRIPVS